MAATHTPKSQARFGNRNNRIGFPHGGKLTSKQVHIIRKAVRDKIFSKADIAHAFNIGKQTVADIGSGKIHRHT